MNLWVNLSLILNKHDMALFIVSTQPVQSITDRCIYPLSFLFEYCLHKRGGLYHHHHRHQIPYMYIFISSHVPKLLNLASTKTSTSILISLQLDPEAPLGLFSLCYLSFPSPKVPPQADTCKP